MKVKWGNVTALIVCLMFATTIRNAYQETWWLVGALGGLLYAAYLAVERTMSEGKDL